MTSSFKTLLLISFLTAIFISVGGAIGGQQGAVIAFGIAMVMNFISYYNSDKIVLAMYKAQPIERADNPELYDMVARLANNAGLPMPKLCIINNPQPNAFATGRNPENGAVCVTTGIMQLLNERELAGVIAHELTHIKNRDTLVMTVTATIAGAISMLANFGSMFGMHRGSSDEHGNRGGSIAFVILISLLAPLAAMLVQMAISRTREYGADRGGAEISGDPEALASALQKISSAAGRINNHQAENNPATAHLFIINPLHMRGVDGLFATHPATENRIAELMKISGEMKNAGQIKERRRGTFADM